MDSFSILTLVNPVVLLLTETGNFALNVVSLVLRLFGINLPFF
mgnify:CR=1 FL=1